MADGAEDEIATDVDRLKVHRRELMLDGQRFTILSPRPEPSVRFSTNRFHDTWHIISDAGSAKFLGRVLWAMAFQRSSPTITVIDQPFLVPNPFDADPSDPIVVVNSDLATPSRDGMAALSQRLPVSSTRSGGTVRLQTRGLDLARADPDGYEKSMRDAGVRWNRHQQRSWIDQVNGMIVLAAPPPVLRDWALELSTLGALGHRDSEEARLDAPRDDGEIQVLRDFDGSLDRAIATRERLFPNRLGQMLTEDEREQVWTDPERWRLAKLA
jgi:hypothetical protein